MAVEKKLPKIIPLGGQDLLSDPLIQVPGRAELAFNFERRPDGSAGNRRGFDVLGRDGNPLGMMIARYFDTDGIQQEELLSSVNRSTAGSILVTYTGAAATVLAKVSSVSGVRRFQITKNGVSVFNYDMGTIYSGTVTATLADLVAAIDALSEFTCSFVAGHDSEPALIIPTLIDEPISNSLSVSFYYFAAINQPEIGSSIVHLLDAIVEQTTFRHLVYVNINNVLYFTGVGVGLCKYDGQTIYGAGLPAGATPSAVATATAGNPNGTYVYAITYEQKDNRGNVIEGVISAASASVSPASKKVDVTVTNLPNTNFLNHNHAKVNGLQAAVTTITVDSGHTLKVGDTAYFLNTASGLYVERTVTAKAATTITISGAVVSVADNSFISNNLRINIWRNKNGGTTFYLVATIPNDPLDATQVFSDNLADASLGAEYITPLELHEAFFNTSNRAITVYQDLLVVGGLVDNQNAIIFSALDGPEYFPGENQFFFATKGNDVVTALWGKPDFLLVFKNNSTDMILGSLTTGVIRRVELSAHVGCPAQNTICDITPERTIFCSRLGVFDILSGRMGDEVSMALRPAFLIEPASDEEILHFERAYAVVDPVMKQYILFIPAESFPSIPGPDQRFPNEFSRCFVYNYEIGEWYEFGPDVWDEKGGFNFGGGAAIFDNNIWWISRFFITDSPDMWYDLKRRIPRWDRYAYVDHTLSIDMSWESGWDHRGEPSQPKRFQRHAVHSLARGQTPSFTLTVKTYKDFNGSTVQSQADLAFTSTARTKEFPLIPEETTAMKWVYQHDTTYERVDISGTETEVAESNYSRLGRK